MAKAVPVEKGQWRRLYGATVLCVLEPNPRRRGFWICASDRFPHEVDSWGRRELEKMTLVNRDYYGGGKGHPGEASARAMVEMIRQTKAQR